MSQTAVKPQEGPIVRTLAIVNRKGLHARASAKFVQTAECFDARLIISRDGMSVGGQSIMGLMMLAAGQGTTIDVEADGPDAQAAMEAISDLLANRFGEEC
ncbi:HPr family phosphocarrier protein [Aureimonas sp. AU4]|uniref:HPr family phosphocarrier protein n=1 Tax=Aureimonas sp. AU4 TaxID=1638163 RepID=UPI000784449B|nr:HPr family phosphocarrier protein [Aureimonas sp. AU4]